MSDWKLQERLKAFRGDLVVDEKGWHISKYYSGPDLRYNGTSFKIGYNFAETYCQNLRKSWDKYQEALIKFDGEAKVELSGFGDSMIYIRHVFGSGITEYRHYGIINHERTLNIICEEIINSKHRALEIQRRMKGFK